MDSSDNKRTRFWIVLVLAVVTVTVYSRVIDFDWVNFDDPDYVTQNKVVKSGLTLHGLIWAFTHCYASNWHPLTWISHMTDYQFFGMWSGGHHVINLLFHTANTVILFLLLDRLTGAQWRSATVAALFALHPLHVESVAWISERKDVLSTFFALLSLLAYTRYAQGLRIQSPNLKRWKWAALAFFALGLLAKPMVVTLPFLMLLLDLWPLQRAGNPGLRTAFTREYRNLILEKWPWFGLTLGSCAMTYYAQKTGGAVMKATLFPFFWRVINALEAYFWYLQKIFWPAHLAAFYPLEHVRPLTPFLCEISILLIISGLALLMVKRRPFLLFGWLWFLGTLVPVIGLVQVGGQSAADRYSYIPSIGIFIMVVWCAAEFVKDSKVRTVMASASACVVLAVCAKLTISQADTWENGLVLFRHAAIVTPTSDMANICLGETLYAYGENAEALEALQTALKLDPVAHDVRKDIGLVFTREHKPTEALWWFDAEAQLDPNNADIQNFLGAELASRGKRDESLLHHTEAVRLKPKNAEFQNNLGAALAAVGRKAEAEQHYGEAVRLEPNDAQYQNNYGTALARAGKTQEAIDHYLIAIRLDPKYSEAYSNLGAVYFGQRKLDAAEDSFRKAISTNSKNSDAYNNLGNALSSLGKLDEAVIQYSQALQLNKTNATLHVNLGKALSKMGRADEARSEFATAVAMAPGFIDARYELGRQLFFARQFPPAREQLTEALKLQPNQPSAEFYLGLVCMEMQQEEEGLNHFRQAVHLRPEGVEALNAAAWAMATSRNDRLRDGTEAVRLAEKACELTSRQQPVVLNTLAASYAEAGRFELAIGTANEALQLAQLSHQSNLVTQIQDGLASYQAKQPYRQKPNSN